MNEEQTKKVQQQWAKIIAKAWADEDFKARLIAEPAETLKAEGMEVPDGITIKVVQDTENLRHIVIPHLPSDASMEVIDTRVAAAQCYLYCYSQLCCH